MNVSASGNGNAAVYINGTSAKINISGGTFTGTAGAAGLQYITGSSVELTGGTYSGTPAVERNNNIVSSMLESGYAYYNVNGDDVEPVMDDTQSSLGGTIMILPEGYTGMAIEEHPKSISVDVGGNATFSVKANGTALTYQWQVSKDGNNWDDIEDADGATYTITGAAKDLDGNQYRCVVSDSAGKEEISKAATLTVYAFYNLTVVNGYINDGYNSTSKQVREGDEVFLIANASATEETFNKWTWTDGVSLQIHSGYSEYSSSMRFSMPSGDLTITATYGEKTKYQLTVVNGTGGGTYAEGSQAPLRANPPEEGQKFDHWEWNKYIDLKFNEGSAYTSYAVIYMPSQDIEITAVYIEDDSNYTLNVINGTADDSESGSYKSGKRVTLTAQTEKEGKPFWKWTTNAGGTIEDEKSATTTFVMPSNAVTVKANYYDKVIGISGYMTKDAFLNAVGLPETVTLTNGTESTEVDVTWSSNLDVSSGDSVSNAGDYVFNAEPDNLPAGYTWPEEGIQYAVKVEQNMVQIGLRARYANGKSSNSITTTINGEEYEITFGESGEATLNDSLLFLSKDTLEKYIYKVAVEDNGKSGYRLNVTITGKNAENSYLNLTNIVGYKYVEDAEASGKSVSHAPESYLIDAEPGKAVYAVPVRIMSNGTYCLDFVLNEDLLEFYTTDNNRYTISFYGDMEDGHRYTIATTTDSDSSYGENGNVFFTVTPPDKNHAWAVMVIPEDRVETGTDDGGVTIDTEWGRELEISWDKPLRFMFYSLIKNNAGNFAAIYLKEEAAVVISEINLTENQPAPVSPGKTATLSVIADYPYQKLTGMANVSYQWYQCDADGKNATKIDGATGATYTTGALNTGLYYYYVEAKFDQFVESNGYYHADGTTMYTDYNSYGWASDTVTKSNVFQVAVGAASTLTADVNKDTFKAGETMTVNAAVSASGGTPTGNIILYWGDPTDGGKKIAEGGLNNGKAAINYTITEEDVYSGPDKELYILYSGDSNHRSAIVKEDIHLTGGLTITAIPQYEAVTIAWEKPIESVTEYKLWISPKDGFVIGSIPVKIGKDETAVVVNTLSDGTPFENGKEYTFILEAYYSGGVIVSNMSVKAPSADAIYGLTINFNGGSGSDVSGQYADGQVIPINAGTRSGYTFTGWTTSDGGTFWNASSAKTTFTMPANDTTITANWKKKSSGSSSSTYYSVIFDTNGGEDMDKLLKVEYTQIDLDEYVPEREGYKFVGWYADEDLTKEIDKVYLTQDITIYAKWEKIEEELDETEEIKEPETISFADVKENDWFYEAVSYAVENGLMNGMGDGTFQPNIPLTREMLAVVLYNVEEQPESAGIITFEDAAAGKWYTDAVAWASQNGILAGYSETEFGVGAPITREQFAAILYRYANWKGYDTSRKNDLSVYTDAGEISGYAVEAMKWAVQTEVIHGRTETTLVPQGQATRAEAATMLMNFCENVVKQEK